ncbi:TPA: hypothetical protein PCO46_003790 [Klebsiella quasipneumoniae subsp. similipneumoniae]|uniref:hypothetical protein n=1 Tax=Klebsiella pneumoniae complex TaxID=3390273 RepID=UPI0010723B6F|nr:MULTISPECIES: hypothetical protein [Klebsiella]MBQ5214315.1 hypothetical protein [Klebsiella quasipneumoniae]MBV5143254.1 hypothetical protein [Klebsiella pneumoniae]RYI79754.1 hypothetical protein EVV55_24925 [Klebsiella pneumoniae]HDG8063196.1 hypothetical protein [Klebsiella quasipneumoniae subsp. similipneumoniae]
MTTDITELTQSKSLRKKLNRRLNDAYGFQRTSGGKHTTISLSIDECKSIIAAMDERLALVETLEKAKHRIAELEEAEQKLCAANVTLDARAELAERQLAELESRTVTVKLASRRLPSDYVDGEFGNDDLAAIHNACRLECKVSVEKYLSGYGIVVKWEDE